MTKRERLTERIGDGVRYRDREYRHICYPKNDNLNSVDKLAVKLCEFEDKIENGTLVELPCKVGQTVYRVVKMGTGIHYKQVGRCGIGHTKGYKIVPCQEKIKMFIRSVVVTKNNFFDVCENFGKTVFLTQEEAEKALERSREKC